MNKQKAFLVALVLVSTLVSLLILRPFLQYLLAAVLFAYALAPVNERLQPYLGRRIAPGAVIAGAMVALFVPIAYILVVLVRDLRAFAGGETELDVGAIEAAAAETLGVQVDLSQRISVVGAQLLEVLFGDISGAVAFGLRTSLGVALMVFLIYYLLKDGGRLLEWLVDIAPMENSVCNRLFDRIDRTTRSVIVGHFLVAVLQGLVGGVGLFIAGIPNVIFWTFVMVVFALLPLVGAFIVWAPASAYLFAVEEPAFGVFLFVYGAVVVGLVDNYARPIIIEQGAHLNPGLILVGVFGGIYAIGMTGLFIGPIVLAVTVTAIEAFDDEYDTLGVGGETTEGVPNAAPDAQAAPATDAEEPS